MKRIAVCMAAVLMATHLWAGVSFTAVTTMEGKSVGPVQPGKASTMAIKAMFDGDAGRMEFQGAGGGPGAEGMMGGKAGYMILKDAGKTVYMVNPAQKTYMKMDLGGAMHSAKAMGGAMKVTDPKTEKVLDEAGPDILGYPTQHLKFKTSYNTSMNIMGQTQNLEISQEEDWWVTQKFKDAWLSAWKERSTFQTGDEGLDALIKAQVGKIQGLPLKTERVTVTKDATGKTQTTKTTMAMTEIVEADIPKDKLDLPADYRELDLGALFQGLQGGIKGGMPPMPPTMPPKTPPPKAIEK